MSEKFNIGHEVDLSEYTSTVTDGGDLSQAVAAALAGTAGGLRCFVDDTNQIYGQINFSHAVDDLRFRFYLDTNGINIALNDTFTAGALLRDNTGGVSVVRVQLNHDGADYRIRFVVIDDSATTNSGFVVIPDTEHFVEIHAEKSTGAAANDGRVRMWIDDVLEETLAGLDLWTGFAALDRGRLGIGPGLDPATNGTIFFDEFILRDDAKPIGPIAPTVQRVRLVRQPRPIHQLRI